MEQILLVAYVLLSVGMIGLILLQQGKGADAGASFGAGASQTVFGSGGSSNALTRGTAILATLFFIASVSMAVIARHKAEAVMGESGGTYQTIGRVRYSGCSGRATFHSTAIL